MGWGREMECKMLSVRAQNCRQFLARGNIVPSFDDIGAHARGRMARSERALRKLHTRAQRMLLR